MNCGNENDCALDCSLVSSPFCLFVCDDVCLFPPPPPLSLTLSPISPSPYAPLSLSLSTDGRSKSKITVDGKCKLLLIREETGGPSKQLCQWADVLLLVFSYADDDSLAQVHLH